MRRLIFGFIILLALFSAPLRLGASIGLLDPLASPTGTQVMDLAKARSVVAQVEAGSGPIRPQIEQQNMTGGGDVTVYRGVAADHPGYADALQGRAMPRGGRATPEQHNRGNTESVYTSWATDLAAAQYHATKTGRGGVILKQTVPRSELVASPDKFSESEVLRQGPVSGATATPVEP